MCIYVDVCTYVSNVRDVFIASMLLEMVTLQPSLSPGPAVASRQASSQHHVQGRPGCGNKTVNVQDLAAFLLVFKLFGGKNDVSHNLINILIVQTPFLPSQPRIAHHFV